MPATGSCSRFTEQSPRPPTSPSGRFGLVLALVPMVSWVAWQEESISCTRTLGYLLGSWLQLAQFRLLWASGGQNQFTVVCSLSHLSVLPPKQVLATALPCTGSCAPPIQPLTHDAIGAFPDAVQLLKLLHAPTSPQLKERAAARRGFGNQ